MTYSSSASTQVLANKNDIVTNVTAIGLNTAKVSYSSGASTQVASNKNDIATNVVDIGLNTVKVTYDGAVQVASNKNDIVTNVSAIALNTAKVTYSSGASTQVLANKNDIVTNVSAIALNTAKVTYSSGASTQVATNVSDIATNLTAINLNTPKLSYTSGASAQVATNVSDISTLLGAINTNGTDISDNAGLIATNETEIDLNTLKLSYTSSASSQVASNKSDISSHAALIANKLNTSGNQTMDGRLIVHSHSGNGVVANVWADDLQVYYWNDVGITIGAPEGKIGTIAFSDQNKADRNQIRAYSTEKDSRMIGMHFLADQLDTAVPTLSVVKTLVGINNAQPTYDLDVAGSARISKNVFLENLPTSDPGVLGQMYVSSGTLMISI